MKKTLSLFLILLTMISSCTMKKPESFTIGKGTFLLNDKPFVVKAAEMHYPRIPAEYWEHRIEMCKALGMNTICLYVFWNIHEQKPGEFDFTGNNDIAEFCKIAQKHDMYVIVRPGPYVCAEWEMGGLPWWLLKEDVALRSMDPYYMERVGIFMHKVGEELADLQVTRGGNIIMVQVENEFGAYATDKPYVSAVRDLVKSAGFTDVPLFQCDWSSTFKRNGLDDLLWTINFGTGADIDKQFKPLKEARPDAPLMCSEFWSGWFDHWGRKHETRDGAVMVNGLRDMLDRDISFSLYMTHGGTTFGWWGGANNPTYSAMCSSYDYDAPISEAGWVTDKYHSLREMMKGYLPKGESLIDIPEPFPTMSIDEIRFSEIAPMFENLPKGKKVNKIMPMEQFDQGWGAILYRTTLDQDVAEGTLLKITEQHDWTQVFVDGKLIARLDRRKGEQEVFLPALKKGAQLDLLVEAMGRVNFDRSIHDRKGITEKVELIVGEESKNLTSWEVFNLPLNYEYVSSKNFAQGKAVDTPAYYRATFHLDKVADTFLDMQTWGKGMVWVNGRAMGRFWEIGPQQTLFMPGCWLNEGENEIIVLDMKGPKEAVVKGYEKPILDMLRADIDKRHRRSGEELTLEREKAVAQGVFSQGNGWQEVKFGNQSGRYFCLEGLAGFDNNNPIAAVAELDLIGKDGQTIPRENWKIVYADSEETIEGNRTADKIYDLQESTFWQTGPNSPYPHQLVIDLGREHTVAGFRYLPRAEQGAPGMIKSYKLYLKKTPFTIEKR